MRCIDWENVTLELLTTSGGGGQTGAVEDSFSLSRPLRPGETIDYFMSHSWYVGHHPP